MDIFLGCLNIFDKFLINKMLLGTFLTDLSLLLLVLLGVGFALSGWGAMTLRILRFTVVNRNRTLACWVGLSVVLGFLEVAHLFVPIDWRVTVFVFVIGVVGQYSWIKKIRVCSLFAASKMPRSHLVATVVFLGIGFYVCLRAMQLPIMFDSGLYHFSSIRWLNEEPIVPGLGNLHWRLALNQSFFGFLALLNIAPYWNKGYAAGGLFLMLLTFASLYEFGRDFRSIWRTIVVFTLGVYLCQLSGSISNPTPDIAVSLLEITVFLFLLELFNFNKCTDTNEEQSKQYVVAVLLLCYSMVAIKLSGLGFAAGSVCVTLFYARRMDNSPSQQILSVIVLIALLGIAHITRGILLSGAPFFPSPIAGFWSLPWAVPMAIAEFESNLIYAWARQPGNLNLGEPIFSDSWLSDWVSRLPLFWKFQLGLASLLTLSNIYCLRAVGACRFNRTSYLIYVPIFVAFIFWIITAPDVRFLGAANTIYFALSVAILGRNMTEHFSLPINPLRTLGVNRLSAYLRIAGVLLLVVLMARWILIQPISFSGWPMLPQVKTHVVTTDFGLAVNVPDSGSECWDAPIPCASIVYGSLRRVPWLQFFNIEGSVNSRYSLFLK